MTINIFLDYYQFQSFIVTSRFNDRNDSGKTAWTYRIADYALYVASTCEIPFGVEAVARF
jgi:hypothetical protein